MNWCSNSTLNHTSQKQLKNYSLRLLNYYTYSAEWVSGCESLSWKNLYTLVELVEYIDKFYLLSGSQLVLVKVLY